MLDYSTRDLSSARPRLVDELVVIPQHYGHRTLFHLEVPSKSRFYRVGEAEYTFLSLLDGNTTIAGAISESASVLGKDALSEQQGFAVCRWLIERGMVDMGMGANSDPIDLDGSLQLRKLASGLNPLFIKKKLGNPDKLLESLGHWFWWVHSPLAIVVWFVVCFAAIGTYLGNADRFAAAPQGLLTQSNWLWLILSWAVLKVLHEIGHGLAAKRYGGKVPEAGVSFILLIPMAYVDVTSSYRFRSRWQRIHTALAGMYVELFLAAAATLAWPHVESEELRSQLFNVMFTASFSTLLFNANALMRFDGYFVLADLLNIPNLYTDGQQFTSGLWKRVLLGEPRRKVDWPGWKGWAVRVYGVLAAMWRVVVSASLAIAASVMFHGAGIVLSVIALAGWLVVPVTQIAKGKFGGNATFGSRWRGVVVATLLIGGITAAAVFIPWPGDRTVPAIVQYEPLTSLRVKSEGFVDEILVANGQKVEAGQLLVRLRNRELHVEREELEFEIARSAASQRMFQQQEAIASVQIEHRHQIEKQRQLNERNEQLASLEIRAPHAGHVLARDLRSRLGTYVEVGDIILEVADNAQKEVHVSIPQPDINAYRASLHSPVRIYLPGLSTFEGVLDTVDPRARRQPKYESFCVPNGGPVSVVMASNDEDDGPQYEYLTPRFVGKVAIPTEMTARLRSGQSGYVSLPGNDISLGRGVYRMVATWVEDKTREAGL
ncbi:MAG: efflux RND transporter periplasmic adaptor subunit [Planctomycetaceae bacterium]